MTGLDRVNRVLAGAAAERPAVLPILHTGLAPLFGVSLGDFFSDPGLMADTLVGGYRRFGYDGVQLSAGVTAEPEALGARVDQPADGGPILREYLLSDWGKLDGLRRRDPRCGGRMPLFGQAVRAVVRQIGDDAFVLITLRGPLLAASQLRGVEPLLMDLIDHPDHVARLLEFTTDLSLALGKHFLDSGAHGLVIGEATCSPSFISPRLYRDLVLPWHKRLIAGLKEAGWPAVGFHICGQVLPIIEDVIDTEADFMDIDYQVPARRALELARGRIVLRGNLDPSSVFRFGSPDDVRSATEGLCRQVAGAAWIVGSGCDIPPGTPEENLIAFMETVSAAAG